MLIAVVRGKWFLAPSGRLLRWIAVALMAAGTVFFWPKTENFWQQSVWWETESAREGLGVLVALLVALSSFLVKSKK